MENANLTPAKFADRLQINRAVISHILNGRNNPSLDVVSKILSEMPYINPEWLINGTGETYKNGVDLHAIPKEQDLFHQDPFIKTKEKEITEKTGEMDVKKPDFNTHHPEYKHIDMQKNSVRKITQIIIYYSDNTFETLVPHPVTA